MLFLLFIIFYFSYCESEISAFLPLISSEKRQKRYSSVYKTNH